MNVKKIFLLILFAIIVSCCSCDYFNDDLKTAELFDIGNDFVPFNKASIILSSQNTLVEDLYGKEIWNVKIDDTDLSELLKDKLKSRIALIFSGAYFAKSSGVTLDSETKDKLELCAKEYYDALTQEEIDNLGLSFEDVQDVFNDYELAKEGYYHIINLADIEVSRDEARVITIAKITVHLDSKNEAANKEKEDKINKAYNEIKGGKDFLSVANVYNEEAVIQQTVSREDLNKNIVDEVFSLRTGEYSDIVSEDDSYSIYYCLNGYDEELSIAKHNELLQKKKADSYISQLQGYLNSHPLVWNNDLWNEINISETNYIKSVNFFDIYNNHFEE